MDRHRLHSLRLLFVLAAGVFAVPAPAPGRVPKVYNALITSNQNLEPSKAYPVYQPVIHDPFAYPFQSAVFYGDYPLNNGLVSPFATRAKQPNEGPQPPLSPAEKPEESKPPEAPAEPPAPSPSDDGEKQATPPPQPPATQSPIPLNQFGLPPQVLPLGRFDGVGGYSGFNHIGPYTYSSYPGFRFYDPYDPFLFNPYANLPPVYRPLTNVLSPGPGPQAPAERPVRPQPQGPPSQQPSEGPAPAEPSDLNVLNYSSKDPSIPNVPPPPPPSGVKTNDSE
ncbi:hypothetical protein O0L34_g9954 [Tuta absoluta]|nr:hypothetical protein O0L34_g9954 [Tuta absoluta]